MKHLLLLLLIVGLALMGCSAEEADETSHEEVQEFSIRGLDELHYDPITIEVVADRPVALTLINEGALNHDFSISDIPLIGEVEVHTEEEGHEEDEHAEDEHEMTMDMDELTLHISAPAAARQTVTFTPAEPGKYEFFCSVPGHREAGMVGSLIVAAP